MRDRRYLAPADGLRTIMAVVVLREKVIKPILAGTVLAATVVVPRTAISRSTLPGHRDEIEEILQELNMAALTPRLTSTQNCGC